MSLSLPDQFVHILSYYMGHSFSNQLWIFTYQLTTLADLLLLLCRTTNSFKEERVQRSSSRKHQRKPWLTSIRLFSQQQPHVTRGFRRPLVVVRLRRLVWLQRHCHCQGTTTNFFHAYHRYSWDVLLKENWWRGKQDQHHHFSQLRTPNSKKELFPLSFFCVMKLFPQTWLLIFWLSFFFRSWQSAYKWVDKWCRNW